MKRPSFTWLKWLAVVSLLIGMLLAVFQPTLAGSPDLRDFGWPAFLLRYCLYAPLCFIALGLLVFFSKWWWRPKRIAWEWLAGAAMLLGVLLAMFQPTLSGSGDMTDFTWPAILLRFCACAPLCFATLGLALFPVSIVRWLFSWRVIKWFLRGAVIVLGLVFLFYVEEDCRGWLAWHNYRHAWEAKGEKFDFASFVPPPVPDDQNFALTPIVASCYSRYLDKNGHRLQPENTNEVNRLELDICRDDIWGGTNATLGDWRIYKKINLEAWQKYYQAPTDTNSFHGRTNKFSTAAISPSPAIDVLLALSNYNSVLEKLEEAADKYPESRFPLNYENATPPKLILPHLPAFGNCGHVLVLRAIAELAGQQTANALAEIKLTLRLAGSIQNEPDLYSQLVRLGLINDVIQPVWEGTFEHKWSEEQLAELDQRLGEFDILADYPFAMRSSRAIGVATVEFMRCNRFRALNCITMINNLSAEDNYWIPSYLDQPLPLITKLFSAVVPGGWFYSSETTIGRIYQAYLPTTNGNAKELVFDSVKRAGALWDQELQHPSPYNAVGLMICPAVGQVAEKFIQAQSSLNLARVACALERYHLAHNEYPENLDALAPQFIAAVPLDIINGQPLHYRRTPAGSFVLYSVGWNEKDDGGIPGVNKWGHDDYREGDWVWQYSKL